MLSHMTKHIIELVIGLWLIASPWVLGLSSATLLLWTNTIGGIFVVIVSAWELFQLAEQKRS